jgi:Xaa-Pro aminopeptidase
VKQREWQTYKRTSRAPRASDVDGREVAHSLAMQCRFNGHCREFPHLNPHWDDVLMEGEIITCEPGLYGPELGGGIRLENQYVITPNGPRNLLNFPLELA